jgi:S-DNA-T family DNA segregation ATPase FtsK/SpoIIIE
VITGPGGVLGLTMAHYLQSKMQTGGSLIVLASALLVGLTLAADEWVLAMGRWLGWVRANSGPMLLRGGAALASAGSAGANRVADVAGRVASTSPKLATQAAGKSTELRPMSRPRQLPLELEEAEAAENAIAAGGTAQARRAEDHEQEQDYDGSGDATDIPLIATSPIELAELPASKDTAPATPAPRITQASSRSSPPKPDTPPAGGSLATAPAGGSEYIVPPLDLLGDPTPIDKHSIEILCREKAFVLEQTLNEFRLQVQVVAIDTGPVITVFELKLAPGIKVSQIASLANDMARALKAPAVRVVAPLPGKNTIGIEVPNIDKEKVRIKELIQSVGRWPEGHALPLFLGKDSSGQPLVSDLTKMPHLLVAGTTGSGKSVCISSIIMSVLMARTPDEVNMILVDPKVVELAMFKDIPHLMCPIVTEISKAESILDWAATKMDERYALLAEAGVKDIRSYNRLGIEGLRERIQPATDEEMARIPVHLPYIVIIIDELADLMMTSAKEVEFYLCRLAQKSRAVGIHLIVSTQRPQANVVTGLIKSNLPCRIAFRVASRLDSRIVLDQNGGEVLMGQGDMLFLPPGSSKLVRAQGTFIADDELRKVVRHCREQRQPSFHPELTRLPGGGDVGERDELFDEAVEMILETQRGSVSLLQRRLNIGYSRASRLIDQMALSGIVGEYKGSQAREVVITRDEWLAMKAARDRDETAEQAESLPGE